MSILIIMKGELFKMSFLSEKQKERLNELERDIRVTWHPGNREVMDVFYGHVIAFALKKNIRLVRKKEIKE